MTIDQHTTPPATITPSLDNAALIATFYGRRGELGPLIDHLIRVLTLQPFKPHIWHEPSTKTFLEQFDPPRAPDTSAVQLSLNQTGAVDVAWGLMRERLDATLPDEALLGNIWGYTLAYEAQAQADPVEVASIFPLAHVLQRLHPGPAESPQPLAETTVPHGLLWLIDIPLSVEGFAAATIYLAVSRIGHDRALVGEVLRGPVAALLMPDLIAHKSYHQIRQYRREHLDLEYRQKISGLIDKIDPSLRALTRSASQADDLHALAADYNSLLRATIRLKQLYTEIARQQVNLPIWIRTWIKRLGNHEILTFHADQLDMGHNELRLLIGEGENALTAAKTTVDLVQIRLDKDEERRQQRIELMLLIVTAVLSTLVLIDKEAARGLLELAGVTKQLSGYGILPLIGVQFGFMCVFTLITIGLLRRMDGPRRQ